MSNLAFDRLDGAILKKYLSPLGVEVLVLSSVDSTNTEAKRRAFDGAREHTLILAESQSAGRGRMGRSFYSPDKTGLYMSLLVPIENGYSGTVGITSAAAVAAVRAIRRVCGIETGIKWVNDIYLDGRKIAGILAESFSVDDRLFSVVGIGVNLYTKDFPDDLKNRAGALMKGDRSLLAAAICEELITLINALPDRSFMEEYRKNSVVLGKRVNFAENGVSYKGLAENVSDDGALTVLLDNGARHILASGEISLFVNDK